MTTTDVGQLKVCLGCGRRIVTWAEQRRQYGRAMRAGLTKAQAGELMPRCQKCTTGFLLTRRPTEPAGGGDAW